MGSPATPGARGALLFGVALAAAGLYAGQPRPVAARVLRVEGEVAHPGWYEAPTVAAALAAAGGPPADLTNRDAPDGATITRVGAWALVQGELDPVTPLVAAQGRVRLNRASLAELEALPRVGPVLAARIVEGRPYRSVDDLDRVKGIGPATLRRLRPLVAP